VTVVLGIDATSVAPDGKGIARVQRGTVRALASLGRHELVVVARHPEELPEVEALRVTPRLSLTWEQHGLAHAAREVDVLLTWTERLPLAGRARFVVWLFEPPTHRIEANRAAGAGAWQRGSDLVTRALWKRSLRRASLVLVGSNATAAAIREIVPARTLYPGLDERFRPGTGESGDYVLHLGSRDPRDDTATAIAAAREAGLALVVAGDYAGPAEGAELVGRVSDERLVELYRGAAAFLDTSLYEGFGYQVVEAMACGTPVVASETTSIPELVGDAGLLCPPRDVAAFAAALRRAVAERGELRRRGLERAQAFTWERTARELADAVDEVAA
jgi:glycosyltransferase involved in cell wall biosynthesis